MTFAARFPREGVVPVARPCRRLFISWIVSGEVGSVRNVFPAAPATCFVFSFERPRACLHVFPLSSRIVPLSGTFFFCVHVKLRRPRADQAFQPAVFRGGLGSSLSILLFFFMRRAILLPPLSSGVSLSPPFSVVLWTDKPLCTDGNFPQIGTRAAAGGRLPLGQRHFC